MRRALDTGSVASVAGFQGENERGAATTLCRGGSDTSALALAVALGADVCEISTDVDGVFTRLAQIGATIDRIGLAGAATGTADFSCTVPGADAARVREVLLQEQDVLG